MVTNLYSSKSKLHCLSLRMKKKHLSNFSKSQPLRRRLLPTNRNFVVLKNPIHMLGIPGTVIRVEKDPYRSSGIVLIHFKNNTCSYYRNIHNLNIGSTVLSSLNFLLPSEYKRGNSSTLYILPTSSSINQIEKEPGISSKYSTSAGTYSTLIRKNLFLNEAYLRLPSGVIKKICIFSFATIGVIGNTNHSNKIFYKAGQNRWLGKKPIVRGVAKNPVDHPHGGGEGKKSKNMLPKTF